MTLIFDLKENTMRTMVKKLTAGLALSLALAGCGTGGTGGGPLAETSGVGIVVPVTAGEMRVPASVWSDRLDTLLVEGATVVVVEDDGHPSILGSGALTGLANNVDTRAEQVAAFRDGILQQISAATAGDPETDPLLAIGEAARGLREKQAGPCTILVGSSLLQTTGALLFQSGLLISDATDIATALGDAGQLPDLKGCAIELLAAGQVGGTTQPQLGEAAQSRLEKVWGYLLSASGAESVTFASRGVAEQPPSDLPVVTVVPISTDGLTGNPDPTTPCQFDVPDAVLGFEPNSAEFIDIIAARTAIANLVRDAAGCVGSISLVSTTSSAGTPQGRDKTSKERATAARDLLAEAMNVPASSITAEGLGYDTSAKGGCILDRLANGELDPIAARSNRKVIVRFGA